ncbi:MAG: histidine kinase [Candidatus Solibacter sp.]|nr:histidine kinase [Candidatus Solibacter sp.]
MHLANRTRPPGIDARICVIRALPLWLALGSFGGAAMAAGVTAATQPPVYVSRIWRTQEGLPENRIRAIAQTPDGYLWLGTSSGLARFDGVRFVVYARFNTPSMTDDNVRALSVAPDGSLWAATDGGGLLHYWNGHFRTFGPREGLANEFVGAVLADRHGDVWAGTNRGLFRRHGEKFERVDEALHLSNIAFFSLRESPDGRIFAGGPAGLFCFENGVLHFYSQVRDLDVVYQVGLARDGSLWLGTNHGLRIIGENAGDPKPAYLKNMIGAILEDHEGNMWLGTEGNGLYRVHGDQEAVFRAPANLPDNSILSILEDRDHSIWVGTADGLVRMSAPEVNVLNSRNGLASDNVVTIYCGQRANLWLTTITGQIFQYANGRIIARELPPPADTLRIRGAFEDHTGAFWFGTDNQGVVRLVKGKATRFTVADGLRNNGIEAFFEDRDRNLWIGTTSGLSRWDGSHLQKYYLEEGLSYGWVRSIAEDNNGDMLVGTDRGLNRFHGGRFVTDPAFAELSRDRIWSIHREAPDTLWIGTRGGGLVRVRNGKAARITTHEGLLSNSIFQVVGDGAGSLWMSGPLGLSAASIGDLNAAAEGRTDSIAVLAYGTGDGLESTQINGGVQPSGCMSSDGELWFPSVKGAVHFKPNHPRTGYRFPVRVESVLVDGKSVPATREVTIGPGRHRVEIEFTTCSLRAPERVFFRYKLENFDARWTDVTTRRATSYDNLPPGQYRFRVISRDGSTDAGSTEAGISIVVRPEFYQTAWFYGLALLMAGAGVAGVFLYQERQAHQRYNLRLAERTRIAREMHDTVVQGCVGVSTLIEAAVGSARSDQDLMLECLDNARIHLRLTLDEARQALTDLRHDSFEKGLAGALSELANTVSGEKGTPVTLQVSGPEARFAESINRTLLLVTREAIRNALMHATPTAVAVRLLFTRSMVTLEVQDNGCGFEPASACLAAEGHFGILGMRERMEQIGGSLEVTSALGVGTIVVARLPLGDALAARPIAA